MISVSIVLYESNPNDIKNIIALLTSSELINEILIHDNSKSSYIIKYLKPDKNQKINYFFNNNNIGYGAGHNKNFKRKKYNSKFFLVINTDIKFNPKIINKICDEIKNKEKYGALIPKIVDFSGKYVIRFRSFPSPVTLIFRFLITKLKLKKINNLIINQTVIRKYPLAQGPFFLFKTNVFEEIKGFDERFFLYMEDVDLQRKIYDKGYRIKFSNEIIKHKHGKGSFTNIKLFMYHVQSSIKYFIKYGFIFDKKRNFYNSPNDSLLFINGNYQITKRFRGKLIKNLSKSLVIYITDETIHEEIKNRRIVRIPFDVEKTKVSFLSFIKSFITLFIIHLIKKPKYVFATHSKSILIAGIIGLIFRNTKKIAMFTGLGYLFHSGIKNNILNKVVHKVLKIVTNNYDLVYTHNNSDKEFLINNNYINNKKIFTINGSGVDTNKFKLIKHLNNSDDFTFIYSGRILKSKGIVELVNTFQKIRKKYKNIYLDIYGNFDSNPESIKEEEFIEKIKNIRNVRYMGFSDNLENVYTKYDAYITASHSEGMSRSILEALSCGLPIIASNISGCKEAVIEDYNGYLFEVQNEKSMETAILKIFKKRKDIKFFKTNSRKLALSKFKDIKINKTIVNQLFKI